MMKIIRGIRRITMKWLKPSVREFCVGMEVTSYDSAEIEDTLH
jgi:coenzyme PQQ precursor peptide PqqA